MRPTKCRFLRVAAVTALLIAASLPAFALDVVDAYYRPDVQFPEFWRFWRDSSANEAATGTVTARDTGGSVHVYLRNQGDQPVKLDDVLYAGISLTRAIAFSDQRKFKGCCYAAGIYFSDLSQSERDALIAAGEPIWWKAEPRIVRPGQTAAITIRLRRTPDMTRVSVQVKTDSGTAPDTGVAVGPAPPRFESISFSHDLSTAYLYVKHARKGTAARKVLLDGSDITAACTLRHDPNIDIVPVVISLKQPLARGTLHCFQVVYDDRAKATASIRPWGDEFGYGMWGARRGEENELEVGRAHVEDMALHQINVQLPITASPAFNKFTETNEGQKLMARYGIRKILDEPEKSENRFAFYLADEPDTADFRVKGTPLNSKVGCLGQGLLKRGDDLRAVDPRTPNMVNVNMTFKPESWYIYGQLPDYFAADPYYQTRLAEVYWGKKHLLPLYSKCTFVHAVASVCQSSCAPNPLHIMLNSVRRQEDGKVFRWGTREEKRIEAFYALAAGAKQLSYWWFVPLGGRASGANGCGANEPGAKVLWNEIGLIGAELRTAGPLIERACPASLEVTAPSKLWVRTLVAGTDSVVLLCVNDDYSNDDKGTNITPVTGCDVSLSVPAWLDPKSVFEISIKGTGDVASEDSGGKLNLHLGTVNVTRMVVVTSDTGLRAKLQKLYDEKFAKNVATLLTRGAEALK